MSRVLNILWINKNFPIQEAMTDVLKVIKEVDKGNYVLKTELVQVGNTPKDTVEIVSAYTKDNKYIGDPKAAKMLDDKGIKPEYKTPDSNICSIGYSDKDKRYFGWSHRVICGFKIGDKLFDPKWKGKLTPDELEKTLYVKRGDITIKDIKQQRQAAINFASDVS